MHITAITICVNYADLLAKSLRYWQGGCDRLIVVTSTADEDTAALCAATGVELLKTDVFYANGAAFNKGAAINAAVERFGLGDGWGLLFDADIIPPREWRGIVESASPEAGNLYGAMRYRPDGQWLGDPDIAGFFHLFHTSDPRAAVRPLVDGDWKHAGNYDTTFQNRWEPEQRLHLPLHLIHQGEPGENWFGRGRIAEIRTMQQDRRRRGGYQHERIQCSSIS